MKSTIKDKKNELIEKLKIKIINLGNEIKKLELEVIALILFLLSRPITFLFTSILGVSGVFIVMLLLLIIYGIIIVKKIKNKETDLLLIFFLISFSLFFLILISAIGDRFRAEWILNPKHGLIARLLDPRKGLFALLLILMVKDHQKVFKAFKISASILVPYLIFQVVMFLLLGSWETYYTIKDPQVVNSIYNLPLGYDFVFCFLIFTSSYIRDKKVINLIVSLITLFFTIYFGSRGALLVAIAYYFIEFLFNTKKQPEVKKRIVFLLILSVIFVAITTYGFNFLMKFVNLKGDVSSRTIDAIVSGEMTSTSGRIKLWSYSLEAFRNSPIIGNGIYGDRLYVGNTFRWGYSHNILLELMSFFGIFGIAITLGLGYLLFKYLISNKYEKQKELFIIMIAMCSKLLLSDSFLHLDMFWMLIGLMVVTKFGNKQLKYKKTGIVALVIIVIITFGLLGLYFKVETNRQINHAITIDKPTVLISFQGTSKIEYTDIFKRFNDKVVKATSFISPGVLNKEDRLNESMINEMAKNGWDFQDASYNEDSVDLIPKDKAINNLKRTNNFYEKKNLKKPNSFLGFYTPKNYRFMEELISERNIVFRSTGSVVEAQYKKISQLNSLDLYTYTPNLTEHNYEDALEQTKLEIEKAYNNKNLILFNFKINKAFTDNFNLYKSYISSMLKIIKEKDFEYITADELADKMKIVNEEKTIIDYIKGMKISDYI